jgi:hypothetical protein
VDDDAKVEAFLDAFGMRGVTRMMMKAKVLQLPPDKQAEFIARRPEVESAAPVKRYNVACENPKCGGTIEGLLHFFEGDRFSDGGERGWFCSAECRDVGEEWEHWGTPHGVFERGDIVAIIGDSSGHPTTLLDEDDEEVALPAGTQMRVVSAQYQVRGESISVGLGLDLEAFIAINLQWRGRTLPAVYVGFLTLVHR